ncbi:hypothetical protein HYDPIDRAFT_115886 [Hydnomerulius pinastri MD-312]|uniref:Uncharacterized protein n=1 Tax=Hydnomerulius pinastri MD-312 TaxID=994086 RepID=A0A0C9V707_9AGAM|nr:hypothetical protein HYDPIDRAFT_115886 [Hydnomerulius pinastri MD-312]
MSNITLSNAEDVLGAPEPRLSQNLTRLFAKLLERNQDPLFVEIYTSNIQSKLEECISTDEAVGFSAFARACLGAGIVKAMFELSTLHVYSKAHPKERYIAQSNAFAILQGLVQCGNLAERYILLDQMLKLGVVDVLLQKLDHPLCIIRECAVRVAMTLSTKSMLGEKIPAATAAEIMVAMCKVALEGPSSYVEEMESPTTGWQNALISQLEGGVLRYYATVQEGSMRAIHGLLCTSPLPSRKFCLDLLKKKPEVLDLLFDCAILPRPPSYPETEASSLACESVALLFQWPSHIVPGVSTPVDSTFKAQEWKAMSQCLTILTSREEWAEKIIEVWMRVEEEDLLPVKRSLNVKTDYLKQDPSEDDPFMLVLIQRGTSRVAMLRLIATLSHAAESCGVTNAEIESFLRIAYVASTKIKARPECCTETQLFTHIERTLEASRAPEYASVLEINMNPPFHIAEEGVLGPTALARLLVVLAQRKAFDTIQGLKKAPNGLSSSTSLNHVQQITHPDVIRRFLTIALQRVRATAQKGRDKVGTGKLIEAQTAFKGAAELAAALVAFDTHTQGLYIKEIRGARKELVLALGNASEMALRQKHYQQALNFGHGAVTVAENIPAAEDLDPKIMAKNKRRVQQAQAAMV